MMDALFEIIFSVIIEGSMDLSTGKKVPVVIRILAGLLLFAVYGGLIALFLYISFSLMKKSIAQGMMMLLISVFLIGMIVWAFIKKTKNRKEK